MHRFFNRFVVGTTVGVLLGASAALPAAAQAGQRCFVETGQCISGRVREYWEQNGGLPVFGLPLGPQQAATIEGATLQVQWFERNRLELHPENARPYDVLLGRLGADRLAQQGRDPFAFPKGTQQNGCRFFAETQHAVCGDILAAWRANGLDLDGKAGKTEAENLALFGLPLSEPMPEVLSDGQTYTVQYFERARFELHPENQPPYNVLLGLLGSEVQGAPAGTPAPQPTPPVAPVPPAPSFNNCAEDPNFASAANYPVQITAIDKGAETVTLKNVSQAALSLDGWRMCSIKGNQEQLGIGGALQPGESRVFQQQGGNIWSNSDSDSGALYDAEGRLVSYYRD